jgi:hypothetical protein
MAVSFTSFVRRTSGSAAEFQVGLVGRADVRDKADVDVGRRPGGPPYQEILLAILTFVALFLWAALLATCGTLTASDAAGNGLSEVWAVLNSFCLWTVLTIILIVSGIRGRMAAWSIGCAVLLVPASCAASVAAVEILKESGAGRWPSIVPALVPPLLLTYAAWMYFPEFRAIVRPRLADGATWTMLLMLSIAPWPATMVRMGERQAVRARVEATAQVEVAHHIEVKQAEPDFENPRARFERLGPDSPLWEWAWAAEKGSEFRDQALADIRQLERRQPDAEIMLERGWSFPMVELPNLALQPTPSFCDHARSFLRRRAEDVTAVAPPPPYSVVAQRIEIYLPAMRWLVENRCDCGKELRAIDGAIKAYPDSPERSTFLRELAVLLGSV